jgi:tetratricopeptide (TPR) repeat protein
VVDAAIWLKGKGDDFYRSGDFASAANVYTAAIDIDPKAVACLSNRAACYLQLLKAEECARDCTAALELTPAAAPAGSGAAAETRAVQSRVRLLARRGTALSHLGRYADALADFQAAGALDRSDVTLATVAGELARLAERTCERVAWACSWDACGEEGRAETARGVCWASPLMPLSLR